MAAQASFSNICAIISFCCILIKMAARFVQSWDWRFNNLSHLRHSTAFLAGTPVADKMPSALSRLSLGANRVSG